GASSPGDAAVGSVRGALANLLRTQQQRGGLRRCDCLPQRRARAVDCLPQLRLISGAAATPVFLFVDSPRTFLHAVERLNDELASLSPQRILVNGCCRLRLISQERTEENRGDRGKRNCLLDCLRIDKTYFHEFAFTSGSFANQTTCCSHAWPGMTRQSLHAWPGIDFRQAKCSGQQPN
ncbi:hypothetical protein EJB05_57232, partial [Eragrostis curvula]